MLLPIEEILFGYLCAEREARELRPDPLPDVLHASASSAGGCARAIGFRIVAIEPSNPITPDALVNFYIGDAVHDVVQKAIVTHWPDATTEVTGQVDDFLTGHCDVLYTAEDGEKVVCEIKTVSDFAYELATGDALKSNGRWKKKQPDPPQGPKTEHVLQDLIYAHMFDAKYIAIVYVRKTAAKDEPILKEWRFVAADFDHQLQAELQRLREIVTTVREGNLPARKFDGNTIYDPLKTRWPCSYCSYLTLCSKLESGIVPLKPSETR